MYISLSGVSGPFNFSKFYIMNLNFRRLTCKLQYFRKHLNFTSFSLQSDKKENSLEKHRNEIMKRGLPKKKTIENVKHIILIASGKGGVGKSTIAVNLAASLKMIEPNKNIGLLDVDVFGPSLPLMMNLHDSPLLNKHNQMIPLNNYGIQCMSFGFLIEEGKPIIWRGLMVMQALEKLMRGVCWDSVDYLIIDTPPGTGDTHLSLIQNLPIDGVILVTIPQKAALQVTERGAVMFQKLNVPIIGLIENMNIVECPKCNNKIHLFGSGTKTLADKINTEILQTIPLSSDITSSCEQGIPIVFSQPSGLVSVSYKILAEKVIQFFAKQK